MQLGWGDAAGWTSHDYDVLSQRIQEKTGRVISATTLKRLWGRITYTSSPSPHSLTTLAAFLEYDSWRAFVVTLPEKAVVQAPTPPAMPSGARLKPSWAAYMVGLIAIASGAVLMWLGVSNASSAEQGIHITSTVQFRSRPVAQGVPNTVIFEYDVTGVRADSFFIQQSWDPRRRGPIAPDGQTLTSIYYRPGFFKAKLIANDSILQEHPIHIKTDDWVIMLEAEPVPHYITERNPATDGFLSISKTWLEAQPDLLPNEQVFSFFKVRDFGTLRTDHFSLETAVRREMTDDRYPCQRVHIVVMGERNMMLIPLTNLGCVGTLNLILGDLVVEGTMHDLSTFGADLTVWQRVQVAVEDNSVTIQVGTNTPYTHRLAKDLGKVVGLSYHFEGVGAIDYVRLKDGDGRSVYSETF